MFLVRFLIVVVLTLSTSLSSALDAGHLPVVSHDHTVVKVMANDQPHCCQDSTERAHTCHALLAVLPTVVLDSAAPALNGDVFCASSLLMTGIEPSGPLDPPREV